MSVRLQNSNSMAVLQKEELKDVLRHDLDETRRTIESAESRARVERKKPTSKVHRKNDRDFAQALHREADELYHSGDYEAALVLYHRAASVFPRDSSHRIAARRTATTISSWNNPSKALRKLLPNVRSEMQLAVTLCPESAAIEATKTLRTSPDPLCVTHVLSYFDNHKDYWKTLPTPVSATIKSSRSKSSSKQQNDLAIDTCLKNLVTTFNAGKLTACKKFAEELLKLSSNLRVPQNYQISAYHYLSLIHVSLGRHDRAVSTVSRMIRLAKSSEDIRLISRSLITLGKVHLSFGHLEAAARAWESLSNDIEEPVLLAWIHHEIGRCYLETGRYVKSMEKATRCTEAALEGNSKKWTLYGKLLSGQSLAKLGRFAEALEELKVSAKITEEEGDTPMLSYIRDLIDKVTRALRKYTSDITNRGWIEEEIVKVRSARSQKTYGEKESVIFTGREESLITTVFDHRKRITECHNETSSSELEEEEKQEENVKSNLEEITIGLKKISSLMHRESSREGQIQLDLVDDKERDEDTIFQGSSTFRITSPRSGFQRNDVASLSNIHEATVKSNVLSERSDDIFKRITNNPSKISVHSVENITRDINSEKHNQLDDFANVRSDRTVEMETTILRERFNEIISQTTNDSSNISDVLQDDACDVKSSTTSMESDDTYLTYVIDRSRQEKIDVNRTDDTKNHAGGTTKLKTMTGTNKKSVLKGERKQSNIRECTGNKTVPGVSNISCEGNSREKYELLNTLGVMEQLEGKSEEELLEMLGDMLLSIVEEDRSPKEMSNLPDSNAFESIKDRECEFRTSRSCEEEQKKVVEKHSLYRHSLPSSPRKYDGDIVSRTCEGYTDTFRSG